MANVWEETPEERAGREAGTEALQETIAEEAAQIENLEGMTRQQLEDYGLAHGVSAPTNPTRANWIKAITAGS